MTQTATQPPAATQNRGVQVSKTEVLKGMLNSASVQEQFKNALKENSGPFVASVVELFSGDKYLQECDPKAVVMEALKAAVLKLPVNKSLGFAYVIPYKGVPQFQIGYKGLIQLAMRTGQYRIINADKVYEGEIKTVNKLTGEFDLTGTRTSDKVIGYFAYIEMLNGFSKTLYMTKDAVEAHGKRYSASFGFNNSPWKKEFDGMALKTVLKNLLGHYGFLSVEMMGAFDNDEDKDVADTVKDEIDLKANTKSMNMSNVEEATVIPQAQIENEQPAGEPQEAAAEPAATKQPKEEENRVDDKAVDEKRKKQIDSLKKGQQNINGPGF